MKFRSLHGSSFHPPRLAQIPSNLRTNSEHEVLAAWLNSLRKSGDSSCAKSYGADPPDVWKNPLVEIHVGNDMPVMRYLDGVENFCVTDILSTPLTSEIEDVDSLNEICSKCNSGHIARLGSADTIEMLDAISRSLCLSCSSGLTQTENVVIEDLHTLGSSCLGTCGLSGHHYCKSTEEAEKDSNSNGVSLNELGSDKVEALNPIQFLPHFLYSRDGVKTGSNDTLSYKSPLPALTSTSSEDNVKFVIPKMSLPQNPLQLLPHMIHLNSKLSAEQLSFSCVVEPVKDDKINSQCIEKGMETGVLQNCAERIFVDTQLIPVMKPALSKRRKPKQHLKAEVRESKRCKPKQHLKAEVRDTSEQPLGCKKVEEISYPVNGNLSNRRSRCDRWSHKGVSSRLKASLRHSKSSCYIDKICFKLFALQHANALDYAVWRRFTSFAFPVKSLEQDVIYSTTADVVAFGKISKRPTSSAKTEATAENFGSTAHERRPKNVASRQKSGCIFASISNKLNKPDIGMSRWWDGPEFDNEKAEYDMLIQRVAKSMPNRSNVRCVPAAEVTDAAAMSKLYICNLRSARCRSGVNIVISARQSLLLNSERKASPLWSKHLCNFRWKSCKRKM